jgi:HK97 family phage major capsid protein
MPTAGTATLTAESGTLTESDPTLSSVLVTPGKYAHLLRASNESLTDSVVPIEQLALNHASVALSQSYGPDFANGTGAGSLTQGFVTGAGGSVVAGGTCTPDSLLRLVYSVAPTYRRNAIFVMNDGVGSYLRRLRGDVGGTSGAFLFPPYALNAPSSYSTYGNAGNGVLQDNGRFESFAGYRVVIDNDIPAHGSGVASVVFGDFSRYAIVLGPTTFWRSDDAFFTQDQVAWRTTLRTSGRTLDPKAFAKYVANAN